MARMAGALLVGLMVFSLAAAPVEARSRAGRTGLWTAVGAGAGFGIGMLVGLTAFDDAINSDRKVWTTAVVGAAAGGALGYFLSRGRVKGGASPTHTPAPSSVFAAVSFSTFAASMVETGRHSVAP